MGSCARLSGRVGLKANLLCRLGLCFSFEEPGLPDGMLYWGEDDGDGREFNRYTPLGEYDLFFMALLRERLVLDGLDPNDERELEDQFKAHLCRGVIMLSSRLTGLEDLADLVIASMELCMNHLVSGECSDDLMLFPDVPTAPIEEEEEDRPGEMGLWDSAQ
jgi:DNA sulfur modification protein DndE